MKVWADLRNQWTKMSGNVEIIPTNCGQESFRRNGVALIVNKRVWNEVLGCNLKTDRMIWVHFWDKPFNIMVIKSVPKPLMLKLNSSIKNYKTLYSSYQKRCPFHHRVLECKSRKSRDIWSNRQVWSWNKKWRRAKPNRVLLREHSDHRKHILPTA